MESGLTVAHDPLEDRGEDQEDGPNELLGCVDDVSALLRRSVPVRCGRTKKMPATPAKPLAPPHPCHGVRMSLRWHKDCLRRVRVSLG